jgi:hypothetical protein
MHWGAAVTFGMPVDVSAVLNQELENFAVSCSGCFVHRRISVTIL